MRRDPALIPLSHDHHRALAHALALRRATRMNATAVRDEFLAFWREHGEPHFAAEERAVLPACREHGGELAVLGRRVLDEHTELRAAVAAVEGESAPAAAELYRLGERLQRHVRFEERVLFPLLESSLPGDKLAEIAARADA